MDVESVSAKGERAAISGYLPQFDAFASFAYSELINDNLEWIKVADPEAEKLDDIQYSTYTEIHAYQVKWTISDAKISYLNFKELLPLITSSWKNIKDLTTSINKKVIPHLLTNKLLSTDDSIKVNNSKVGSFSEFFHEALPAIKNNQPNQKWELIIQELKESTSLNDSEFNEFINLLVFQPEYVPKSISISKSGYSQQDDDLTKFSRFIIEKVADKKRPVAFTNIEIIRELGWENRVKTTFNHELIVDKQKYQPIESTINLLDSKLKEYDNGYIFLLGGPGTGKSTLLTQWSKYKKDRVIKYYAFDFTNASIKEEERGDSTYMLFDLVFQIKEHNLLKESILPYKDIIYLREKFHKQIAVLGNDYLNTGRKTILIIDGLDHVPREYTSIAKSFLKDLPLPIALPKGVYIILGSQSYELDDIGQEIKAEYKKGERTIKIDPLHKKAILQYLESTKINRRLSSQQQQNIVEKSQGHPLYLSYIVEKLQSSDELDNVINSFITIDGVIDNYYNKIWEPIQKNHKLIELLGLFSRINGSVNPSFVGEWGYDHSILKDFREKAKLLFNDTQTGWTFFHNSFKQFLLHNTSLNPLTDQYDSNLDINYHKILSGFYEKSKIEFLWKRHYHLFKSKQFDKFIEEVTPEYISSNLLDFRPAEEIIQDAKLGVEISKASKNIYILTRYLFVLAEIERRLYNIDPAAFTKELVALGKSTIAKNYLRTENSLNCSDTYALKAAATFLDFNDKSEASLLFNMAYPDSILDSAIEITDSHRYDEVKGLLEAWVYIAPNFIKLDEIVPRLNNIRILINPTHRQQHENENDLRLAMLNSLSYSLINRRQWTDTKQIILQYNLNEKAERHSFFIITESAIEECLEINDYDEAKSFMQLLLNHYKKESSGPIAKIHIADLIYKTTSDIDSAYEWIKDLNQPSNVGKSSLGYEKSFDIFMPLIKLNKILNLSGKGVTITNAIPSAKPGTDDIVLVEFERMLCLITEILCDGISNKNFTNIVTRIKPIIRYYYKSISFKNRYWHKLELVQGKYFDFLIYATSKTGNENLKALSDCLFKEIINNTQYWPATLQRKVIKSLLLHGTDNKDLRQNLMRIESFMLNDQDIDGRIEQCTAHARLWLHLNENEIAEKWLKQAIQESIGVGYRKDYQFSTWIEWLNIINKKDPKNGSERILWFLSHIRHIKNSTEGRAYWNASKELLEGSFDWNINAGFIQLKWQLENGLIDFEDSISAFVFNYVQRSTDETQFRSILQLYTEIVLFNIEGSTVYILNEILKKGFTIIGNSFIKSWVPDLIMAIEIKSLEENRFGLLSAVKNFVESLNTPIIDIYPGFELPVNNDRDRYTTSSNTLRVKNGAENLSEEDVLFKVNDFQSFKHLLEQEDNAQSYFNWDKVIDKISPTISLAELKDLFIQDKNGRRGSDYYVRLSELALNLGDKALALEFANRSLELSSESGWVQMYDGGTRIKSFKAMNAANPKVSSDKAFEVFSHDLLNGNYASNYAQNLENIIPVLEPNFDEKLIWDEIFRYLQRLMANSQLDDTLPEFANLDKNITETLIDYLIYLSNNPIFVIKESAIKLLIEHINNGNAYAISYFTNIDITVYENLEVLNDITMCLIETHSEQLIKFKDIASRLAISKDYLIRYNACSVLLILDEEIPDPEKVKLPEIYNFHLDELKTVKLNDEIDPYFPEVDLNDPEDLLRPFTYLINFLSKRSGINRVNLIYRHNSIMTEFGTPAKWSVQYEKEFRNHLEEIRVKYPFSRPRVIDSKRAIMRLAAELIDSNSINEDEVYSLLISHDFAVPYYPETIKPKFIQPITRSEFGSVENDWINKINEYERFNEGLVSHSDHSSVIGEYSVIKNLNWGTATETYMSQIAITNQIGEDHFIFAEAFQVLGTDYYELNINEPSIIVIRSHRFDQFSIKSNWIAINPDLAWGLGWTPNPDKLFSWVDNENNLMAESIYWANGNTGMMPPKLHSESGEGWIVVISDKALEQIKNVEPILFIQKVIRRSKWDDERLNECASKKVISL